MISLNPYVSRLTRATDQILHSLTPLRSRLNAPDQSIMNLILKTPTLTQKYFALAYTQGSTAASTQYDNYFVLKGASLLPFLLCKFLDPRCNFVQPE